MNIRFEALTDKGFPITDVIATNEEGAKQEFETVLKTARYRRYYAGWVNGGRRVTLGRPYVDPSEILARLQP